ncbi:MAG TPA: trypsin-like peptidase domain-containing protein [Candidatus Polarisedimenticolia bacterium]|nr:trypsin-like peptidase domain-containing protein [Candidatus Polarisedimenticolia bacterium]
MLCGTRGILSLSLLCMLDPGTSASAQDDPARLVYLLQYIGADYGVAVQDGRLANETEYQEMLAFSGEILAGYRALRGERAAAQIVADLEDLGSAVHERRTWDQVRSLAHDLTVRLSEDLKVETRPAASPDLARGRLLYLSDCAICHGERGAGDGLAAAGQDPPPASFRNAIRMNLVSPHQVTGAMAFGVDRTAMPSFGWAYTDAQLWDVAFFVMTLRDGFDPRPPTGPLEVSLSDLARYSNEELIERARISGPPADLKNIDFFRANFWQSGGGEGQSLSAAASREPGAGLATALDLETAFEQVAESVSASVAGISLYRKEAPANPGTGSAAAGRTEAWRQAGREQTPYPGYRRVRSGSGVFVTEDGFLLTRSRLLADDRGMRAGDIIDVEVQGNLHYRARLIGLEPAIDLAVIKAEAPVPMQPARFGDSDAVRVGQWAIAVGDPPGVEKTFAPGTIAARAERDCYQENRTSTLLQSSIRIGTESFGGPVVNIRGEVIGIAVPRARAPGAAVPDEDEAVYALPINLARTIYEALKVKESTRSPWLGFSVLDLTAELRRKVPRAPLTGIYIDDVFDPSPAARAGIRVGDVLTAMDGNRVFAVPEFQKWLYLLGIGHAVTLEIVRDGAVLKRAMKIEQRPATIPTR